MKKLTLLFVVFALLIPLSVGSAPARVTKYYAVDRVLVASDYAKLAGWGVNTAIVNIPINGSTSSWQSVYNAASAAGVRIVIWPDQGGDVSGCGWENPFNNPQNGDYIWRVKLMLDWWAGKAIGIVTAHEPAWNGSSCKDSISDMATIKSQIKAYAPTIKVWNYIDNISDVSAVPGYSSPADYDKIMDVAVTWQHCAGGAEGSCSSAQAKIVKDRQLLTAASSQAELVYLMQTFTTGGGYGTKFTLTQLQDYSGQFLNTSALDGFGYYTWNAGWWPDLRQWTELHPAVRFIYDNYVNSGGPTSTPAPATVTNTPAPATRTPTRTRTPAPVTATRTATAAPGTATPECYSVTFKDGTIIKVCK